MYTPVEARIAFSDTAFLTVTCVQRALCERTFSRAALLGARPPARGRGCLGLAGERERAPAAAARARLVS